MPIHLQMLLSASVPGWAARRAEPWPDEIPVPRGEKSAEVGAQRRAGDALAHRVRRARVGARTLKNCPGHGCVAGWLLDGCCAPPPPLTHPHPPCIQVPLTGLEMARAAHPTLSRLTGLPCMVLPKNRSMGNNSRVDTMRPARGSVHAGSARMRAFAAAADAVPAGDAAYLAEQLAAGRGAGVAWLQPEGAERALRACERAAEAAGLRLVRHGLPRYVDHRKLPDARVRHIPHASLPADLRLQTTLTLPDGGWIPTAAELADMEANPNTKAVLDEWPWN